MRKAEGVTSVAPVFLSRSGEEHSTGRVYEGSRAREPERLRQRDGILDAGVRSFPGPCRAMDLGGVTQDRQRRCEAAVPEESWTALNITPFA